MQSNDSFVKSGVLKSMVRHGPVIGWKHFYGLCHTFIESWSQGVLWIIRVVIQPESSGCVLPHCDTFMWVGKTAHVKKGYKIPTFASDLIVGETRVKNHELDEPVAIIFLSSTKQRQNFIQWSCETHITIQNLETQWLTKVTVEKKKFCKLPVTVLMLIMECQLYFSRI